MALNKDHYVSLEIAKRLVKARIIFKAHLYHFHSPLLHKKDEWEILTDKEISSKITERVWEKGYDKFSAYSLSELLDRLGRAYSTGINDNNNAFCMDRYTNDSVVLRGSDSRVDAAAEMLLKVEGMK